MPASYIADSRALDICHQDATPACSLVRARVCSSLPAELTRHAVRAPLRSLRMAIAIAARDSWSRGGLPPAWLHYLRCHRRLILLRQQLRLSTGPGGVYLHSISEGLLLQE